MNADDDYADLYGDDEGQPQAVSAGAPPEVPDQAGKSAEQAAMDAAIEATLRAQFGESSENIQAALSAKAEEEEQGAVEPVANSGVAEDGDEEEDSDDDLDIVTVAPQRSVDFRNPQARVSGPGAMFLSGMGLTHQMLPQRAPPMNSRTHSGTPSVNPPSGPPQPQATLAPPTSAKQEPGMTETSMAGQPAAVPDGAANGASQAASTGSQPVPPSGYPIARAPDSYPQVDYLAPPLLQDGQSVYDYDLTVIESGGQPWRRPGSDLSRWFNYGFDEVTWIKYCEYRRDMSLGREALMNLQPGMQLPPDVAALMHMPQPVNNGAAGAGGAGGGSGAPDAMQQMQQMQQMMMQQMMQQQGGGMPFGMNPPGMMGDGMMGMGGAPNIQQMMGMMGGTPANNGAPALEGQPFGGEEVRANPEGMQGGGQPDFAAMQQGNFGAFQPPAFGTQPGMPMGPGAFRGAMRGRGTMRGGINAFRGRGGAMPPAGPRNPNAMVQIPTGPKAGRHQRDRDRGATQSTELDYGGSSMPYEGTPTPSTAVDPAAGEGGDELGSNSPAGRGGVRRGSPDVKRERGGSAERRSASPRRVAKEEPAPTDGAPDVPPKSRATSVGTTGSPEKATDMRIKGKSRDEEREASNGRSSRDEKERDRRRRSSRDRERSSRDKPSAREHDRERDRKSGHRSEHGSRRGTSRSHRDSLETGSNGSRKDDREDKDRRRRDDDHSRKRSASPVGEDSRASKSRRR